MITVAAVGTRFEAEVIRGLLETEGLHPRIVDDDALSGVRTLATGARITVPEDEAAAARAILEDADLADQPAGTAALTPSRSGLVWTVAVTIIAVIVLTLVALLR